MSSGDNTNIVIRTIKTFIDGFRIKTTSIGVQGPAGPPGPQGTANLSAGIVDAKPAITDNGDGTVNLVASLANLFSTTDKSGDIGRYNVAAITNLALTDLATNYIIVNYNSGSPEYQVTQNVSIITESEIIPVYTILRQGVELYMLNWDSLGSGLSNNLHAMLVKTERFRRQNGLILSELGVNNVALTAGIMWTGAVPHTLPAFDSTVNDFFHYYHVGGVWTTGVVTKYNNTQYDDGADLVTLTNNKWVVNWLYRVIDDDRVEMAYVLGDQQYSSSALAELEAPPSSLPPGFSTVGILVGRIIVQKSAATGIVESSFTTVFAPTAVPIHNDLASLQGGAADEYYHLTSAEKINLFKMDEMSNMTASKTTPIDADNLTLFDSVASVFKKLSWANLKATLKTYFDTLYAAVLGSDDNYVTDAEKVVIGNTSGTNTGDKTLNELTPTTTKGDILVDNGSGLVRLPVGTNDEVLTADSSEASGLKYAASGGGGGGAGFTYNQHLYIDSGNINNYVKRGSADFVKWDLDIGTSIASSISAVQLQNSGTLFVSPGDYTLEKVALGTAFGSVTGIKKIALVAATFINSTTFNTFNILLEKSITPASFSALSFSGADFDSTAISDGDNVYLIFITDTTNGVITDISIKAS